MTRISHRLAAGGLALALIACGEDNICLNCGAVPEPTPGPRDVVSVEGNIRNWDTQDDLTRIKVIGCIDLAPDALFFLSRAAPALFPGFTGALDASGTAQAGIQVPAGPLQGIRFFVSFVTIGGGGLKTIANTAGFTIQ